jgi:uncharacterized membrane protein
MKVKDKRDFRIIDESFGVPSALMAMLNLIGYATMALPFLAIVSFLFLEMWAVNTLRDFIATEFVTVATIVPIVATVLKLTMVLVAARSMFLTMTVLPPFLPEFIELIRKELRKDLGL